MMRAVVLVALSCVLCADVVHAQSAKAPASVDATIMGINTKAEEFRRSEIRITSITLGPPGVWALVGHNGASWYHGVPQALIDRVAAIHRDNGQVVEYALGPQGEWAVTNTRGWWLGTGTDFMIAKAREFHAEGHGPRRVSYGPNGSWTMVSASGDRWWIGPNTPAGAVERARQTCTAKNPVMQIPLGPNNFFAVICRGGVWWMGNVPMAMVEQARDFQRRNGAIVSMSFGPDRLWAMVAENGAWWVGRHQ